jgi:hypothetical protein
LIIPRQVRFEKEYGGKIVRPFQEMWIDAESGQAVATTKKVWLKSNPC